MLLTISYIVASFCWSTMKLLACWFTYYTYFYDESSLYVIQAVIHCYVAMLHLIHWIWWANILDEDYYTGVFEHGIYPDSEFLEIGSTSFFFLTVGKLVVFPSFSDKPRWDCALVMTTCAVKKWDMCRPLFRVIRQAVHMSSARSLHKMLLGWAPQAMSQLDGVSLSRLIWEYIGDIQVDIHDNPMSIL